MPTNKRLWIRLTLSDVILSGWQTLLCSILVSLSSCFNRPLCLRATRRAKTSLHCPTTGKFTQLQCFPKMRLRPLTTLLLLGLFSHTQMGTFGPGCLKRCNCVHADGCQASSGECHCLPGWGGKSSRAVAAVAVVCAATLAPVSQRNPIQERAASPSIYTSDEFSNAAYQAVRLG